MVCTDHKPCIIGRIVGKECKESNCCFYFNKELKHSNISCYLLWKLQDRKNIELLQLLILQMDLLPPGPVSVMEVRIPPEFMKAIAALVQEPGWASVTYCNIANSDDTP